MSNNETSAVTLIDGKLYQFKHQGRMCAGIFLEPDYVGESAAFYCNGKPVCKVSEAVQVERVYRKNDLKHIIDTKIANSLVIVDSYGNTVDFNWSEGVLELAKTSAECYELFKQFKGKSVEVRTPAEYGVMLGAFMSIGANIWPYHKGYKPLEEDETHHTYAWEDCGILKLAGVLESMNGDFKSPLELVEAIRAAQGLGEKLE